ncbi:MAG: 30S ribosome-binding factor RbfA [Pseudomonadota bacterium]
MAKHAPSKMPSQRQLRVGETIRHAISSVLARGEVFDPDLERTSITVGEVQISPDLRHAKVFVLPLGGAETDTVLKALERNRHEIRKLVTRQLTLKYSPDLRFLADRTFDRMDETRAILSRDEVRRDLDEGRDAPAGKDREDE